jgi:hypothetical protein
VLSTRVSRTPYDAPSTVAVRAKCPNPMGVAVRGARSSPDDRPERGEASRRPHVLADAARAGVAVPSRPGAAAGSDGALSALHPLFVSVVVRQLRATGIGVAGAIVVMARLRHCAPGSTSVPGTDPRDVDLLGSPNPRVGPS